ncbi:hypothetical protein LSS_16101 [Leptospira santarosai serovar Shermani str. LT 821]|uniref:Uncharacterized protein n=1 Tax=Leptospira santarosai serovar Shermani str. LT 821 TaxID=758847 RepID=K8Y7I1_9LEPT|nr:hypothetical protein LSS_16101 [Leptospira santarosai serovar Shermani str. LT 821]EPG81079.1 hypothetical protein LEP1GSC048_1271 [Leptospira santarosai serovar Shermani str. 1342KT]
MKKIVLKTSQPSYVLTRFSFTKIVSKKIEFNFLNVFSNTIASIRVQNRMKRNPNRRYIRKISAFLVFARLNFIVFSIATSLLFLRNRALGSSQ